MGLNINWENKIVEVTSPTTDVDAQTLHDFIEDNMATSIGMNYDDIIQPEGKVEDPSNPGVYSQIIMIFNSPWQIQFWGGSGYTRIYGGKIVGGLADEPVKATGTAGDLTVLESPVDGLTVAVEAIVPASEIAVEVADAVWDENIDEHEDSGTYGGEIATKADLAASASTDQTTALSGSVVYGTETSGTYADTVTRDGTYWQVTEDASDGITVEMTFNLPSAEHRAGVVEVFGRYTGNPPSTHHQELWAYNYESTSWEQLDEEFMAGGNTSDTTYTHEYYERHIDRDNSNEVKIRIIHNVTTYNGSHNVYLDYVEVSSIRVVTATDIANEVWAHADAQTLAEQMLEVMGLNGENTQWSSIVHNAQHLLTSARITMYTDNTLVTPVKSWDVTADYDVDGELTTYEMAAV